MSDAAEKYSKYWETVKDKRVSPAYLAMPIIQQLVQQSGFKRILDIGCGSGVALKEFIGMGLDARGCDVTPNIKDVAGPDLSPYVDVADAAVRLPYPDRAFDISFCCDMLEHIEEKDIPRVFSEISRVAGVAYLQASCRPDRETGFYKNHPEWNYEEDPLHICVKPPQWWENAASPYFTVLWSSFEHGMWWMALCMSRAGAAK